MKLLRILILEIMIITTLASCSMLSPVKPITKDKFLLDTIPTQFQYKHVINKTLYISMPESAAVYNTTRIAYSYRPHEIAYFAKNEWADNPSIMLQNLLAQTFTNARSFKTVITTPSVNNYDYQLQTQILKLQQNFSVAPAEVELAVSVQLIKISSDKIIATKTFLMKKPIIGKLPYDGIRTTNAVFADLLFQIQQFCVAKIHK